MSDLPAPVPETNPETEPYWDATADDEFLVKRCTSCEEAFHYPRAHCPHCHADETEWIEASGNGTIYTYSVVRQGRGPYGEATPYVVAYVELVEGPRIVTNIVDAEPEELEIGQAVTVVFDTTEGDPKLPRFTPSR